MSHKFNLILAVLVVTAIGLIDNFLIKESRPDPEAMVWIEAGSHPMAFIEGRPNEILANSIELYGFWIDANDVTQLDYEQFVADTGHIIFPESDNTASSASANEELNLDRLLHAERWNHSRDAVANSETEAQPTFVHVAYEDAQAYCEWLQKDLPTEAQFGFAARGERKGEEYNWNEKPMHRTGFRCVTNQTILQRLFK